MIVKATREGLAGQKTASGFVIDNKMPFAALPSRLALYRFIRVKNPVSGKSVIAIVLDVGPWNTDDDSYVFGGKRPASESGESVSGKGTNNSGIDLSERIWVELGMTDNSEIEWEFIDGSSA